MNAFSADVNSRQVVQPLAMMYSTWFEISVSESGGRNENVSNTLQVAVFWAPTLTLRMCNEKSTRCLPENADKCSLHVHRYRRPSLLQQRPVRIRTSYEPANTYMAMLGWTGRQRAVEGQVCAESSVQPNTVTGKPKAVAHTIPECSTCNTWYRCHCGSDKLYL